MEKHFSTSSFDHTPGKPWGGLAAIAIIMLVEWVFYQPLWSVRAGREHGDRIVAAKVLYVEDAPASDYLFLGDSTVSVEIDAEFLTAHFAASKEPVSFLNFGLVGSTSVVGTYFMFERYLKHHPKPKGVFLVFSPLSLNYRVPLIIYMGRLVRYFHRWAEIDAYSFLGSDTVCLALLYGLVPSSEWNGFFRDFPRSDLKSLPDILDQWKVNGEYYPRMARRRGFTPVTDNEPFDGRSLRLDQSIVNRLFLDVFLKKLEAMDVKVYFSFAVVPETPYRGMKAEPGAEESLQAFYRDMEARGVKRLPLPEYLPDASFGSLAHLKESATPAFNQQLAEDLEKLLEPAGRPAAAQQANRQSRP